MVTKANIMEEGPIDYLCIIHPQGTADQKIRTQELEPDKKSQILSDRLNKEFDWDYDTKQVRSKEKKNLSKNLHTFIIPPLFVHVRTILVFYPPFAQSTLNILKKSSRI